MAANSIWSTELKRLLAMQRETLLKQAYIGLVRGSEEKTVAACIALLSANDAEDDAAVR